MRPSVTEKLDKILLNKVLGIPFFLAIMWLVFQMIFIVGQIPMAALSRGVHLLQDWLTRILPQTVWKSLIVDGIVGGVGAMAVFAPLILLLFLFLSILQQTGYLPRASQLFSPLLKRIGLQGKAIAPLMMGYGCNVPAIMAVRNLDSVKEKLIVAMMIPFLSCGAVLPVFTLLIAAFFEEKWRGSILFLLYVMGIVSAIGTAKIFNRILKGETPKESPALPVYKMPKLKTTWASMWNPMKNFILKAGKIILPFSIIIWLLFSFPQTEVKTPLLQDSFAGKISMAIEPAFKPIGFDWKIIAGLMGALGAKEVFISTFGILYSLESDASEGLILAMRNDPAFTPLVAMVLLIFILLYSPCIPVIAVFKQEFGTRWAIISFLYPTVLAWISCFLIYQIGRLFGL